jgi:predicted dehydrogenase
MTTLADLHNTVATTLASRRLGKAVFVRYHLNGVLDREKPGGLAALATVAAVVGNWFDSPGAGTDYGPDKLMVLSSGKDGREQTTLNLRFPNGRTALISSVHGQPGGPGVDLMLLGNQGGIYHHYDSSGVHSWEQTAPSLDKRDNAAILAAIEKGRDHPGPVAVRPLKQREPTLPSTLPGRLPQPKYGVLLVSGSHTHQENYAAAFFADKRCKLIAVTDEPDVDKRRHEFNLRLADVHGVPYLPDLGKALERKDVHIVSVCAPPERRGRIAVRCAEAGKHLYLDKSLAPKLAEADALVAAVRKAGVRSHMFTLVTQPWAQEAKRIWKSGKLGTPLAIHADALFAKGPNGRATLGRPRKEDFPPERHQLVTAKRELDNVGVYPITMIRWLTGKKFRTVYGVTANYFFLEHQANNVEDFGLITGTLDDGLPVSIAAGRCGWTTHPAGGVARIMLVGSERTLIVDANRPRLEVSTDETPWVPPNVNPADPMGFWSSTMDEVHLQPKRAWMPLWPSAQSDASYFVDCLEAGRDSELAVPEAALAAEVLLAAYRSAASGEVVTLPLSR